MMVRTSIKRFIAPPIKHMLHAGVGLAFVVEAEKCYLLRDFQGLDRIVSILCRDHQPDQLKQAGQYYKGQSLLHRGLLTASASEFSNVSEKGPLAYRVRAHLALGAQDRILGNLDDAEERFQAAERISRDTYLFGTWGARKMLAVVAALKGDHKRALYSLQAIEPMARVLGKRNICVTYDHLNSTALELAANNETGAALVIADQMRNWPILNIYPEFSETYRALSKLRPRKSRIVLPSDTYLGNNARTMAAQAERAPEVKLPGRVLPFERPDRDLQETMYIKFSGYEMPIYDGPRCEELERDIFRALKRHASREHATCGS